MQSLESELTAHGFHCIPFTRANPKASPDNKHGERNPLLMPNGIGKCADIGRNKELWQLFFHLSIVTPVHVLDQD